jgi:hypothetical protein
VCIWKDPVTAMQRTKALGLLHKQLKKDSAMSRQGIPDYLVTMRKPATTRADRAYGRRVPGRDVAALCLEPGVDGHRSVRHAAIPIRARGRRREAHLPAAARGDPSGHSLWTNPGDVVLSPFARHRQRGLRRAPGGPRFDRRRTQASYYEQNARNLLDVSSTARKQLGLFAAAGA